MMVSNFLGLIDQASLMLHLLFVKKSGLKVGTY